MLGFWGSFLEWMCSGIRSNKSVFFGCVAHRVIDNVLGLAEGGAFEAPSVKLLLMFIRSRKVYVNTSAPLLASCCYGLPFFPGIYLLLGGNRS